MISITKKMVSLISAPPAALPIPSSASPPTLSLSSLQQPPAVAPPSIASSNSSSPSTSLLSTLLSARRPSPSVPQSRTEQNSGLNSPPRNGIYQMQQVRGEFNEMQFYATFLHELQFTSERNFWNFLH